MSLAQQASPEPEYVQQIRRHKEEIAAQIASLLDDGYVFENLGAYLTDGTDRLSAFFVMRHHQSAGPMVAVVPMPDLVSLAEEIVPGMGRHFNEPAPRWHIRVLSCAAGEAHPVLLRCFPDAVAAA